MFNGDRYAECTLFGSVGKYKYWINYSGYHLSSTHLAVLHGGAALTSLLCAESKDLMIDKWRTS